MRTDAEKRSLVESGLSWDSDDTKPSRKSQGSSVYDTGSLKSESAHKWKKTRPPGDGLQGGKGELKKPQTLGQGNVLKKGRNPPVGVTSPITHTSQSGLRVAGKWRNTHSHRYYIIILYIHIYIFICCHTLNGFITWADWQSYKIPFFLAVSHPHTQSQTHSLSLSHTFIHSCSPPSGPLESGAMYQTPITAHSLPASQPHTYTHTDQQCFSYWAIHFYPTFIYLFFCWWTGRI